MKTMRQSLGWPIAIVAAGIAVIVIVVAAIASPLRPILVFGFLLICPGMAFVRLLRLKDRFAEFMLAVALSLAMDTLLSEMLVLTGHWSLTGGVIAIVAVAIVGASLQLFAARRATMAIGD
jgi:hypothetical protein